MATEGDTMFPAYSTFVGMSLSWNISAERFDLKGEIRQDELESLGLVLIFLS
jgi:hypothetical protein